MRVSKSILRGTVAIPPSKSHTMRTILFGALGKGKTLIHSYLPSADTLKMIEAMRLLGATIECHGESLTITGSDGKLQPCENVIDAGNSGIVLRFCAALAALMPTYTVITGDHSIRHNRPVLPLLSALTDLGALATSSRLNGRAPIIIRGPIFPGNATLNGADSQPISALLIAASLLEGTTHLTVTDPGEKPWIDLTLSWLLRLGGNVTHHNYEQYTIQGGLRYEGFEMTIPGDFSSAAFPLVAALVTRSALTLENIDMEDVQGDKKIIDVLVRMGAKIDVDKRTLRVYPSDLQGTTIDANDIIDAIPILAVVGCFASGKTEIIHAAIARHKESDRLSAITCELKKMGAQIEEREDGLVIYPSPLKGGALFSHDDHRIAMALAVAALAAEEESRIDNVECIAKTYPSFITDFQKIGGQIAE